MALDKLYKLGARQITRSSLCFDEGVQEIGGPEKVASLSFVTEERPRMEEGAKVYGRVSEGIVVVSAGYAFNPKPFRAIVPVGLPLLNPKQATDENRQGNLYSVGRGNLQQVVDRVRLDMTIDEKDVKNNILEMSLKDFLSKYSKSLFGGQGSKEQIEQRVKNAGDYFRRELDCAGKNKVDSIKLYLPPLDSALEGSAIGTQIFACGVDYEFDLGGIDGGLHDADGVFGVSD